MADSCGVHGSLSEGTWPVSSYVETLKSQDDDDDGWPVVVNDGVRRKRSNRQSQLSRQAPIKGMEGSLNRDCII